MPKQTFPIFITTSEIEIIHLLSKLYTKKQIADKFKLNEETIEKHLEHITRKMDIVQSCNYYFLCIVKIG